MENCGGSNAFQGVLRSFGRFMGVSGDSVEFKRSLWGFQGELHEEFKGVSRGFIGIVKLF